MSRQHFQVQHLRAPAASAASRRLLPEPVSPHTTTKRTAAAARERRDDVPAVSLVPALELHGAPADLLQHVRERAAALAAAPAIDERRPLARLVAAMRLEDARDVARDDRGAVPLGARMPIPARACVPTSARSSSSSTGRLIAPGIWSIGELGRAAHVDAIGCSASAAMPTLGADGGTASLCATAARAAATRCRAGAPAPPRWDGCGPAWKNARSSPKPSKNDGTSGTLRVFATPVNSSSNSRAYAGP